MCGTSLNIYIQTQRSVLPPYCVTTSDVVQQPLEQGHAEGDLGGAEARLLGPPEPRAVVVQQGHLSHAALSLAQAKGHLQLSVKTGLYLINRVYNLTR